LIYWIYYERIMFTEEQFLRKKFGQNYIVWAEKTPAFIPTFKNYQPNIWSFSWKKVLREEKNGLLALFLIFAIFDILSKIVEHRTDYNYYLIVATILIVIAYLVLKYLKSYTHALNEDGR